MTNQEAKSIVIKALSETPTHGDSAAIALENAGVSVIQPDKFDIESGNLLIFLGEKAMRIKVVPCDD